MPIVIEMVAYVVIAVLTWFGMHSAIETVLFKAQTWTGLPVRTPAELHAGMRTAYLMFLAGMGALALARFTSLKRGRGNIDVPLLVPAMCAAAAIGLCLQIGYANPLHLQFWSGPEFARGFLIAAALGAFIILLPRDPVDVFSPLTPILPVLMIGTFVALRIWGRGTEAAPDTLINLGPIQPLELVKLAFVVYLSIYFGRRAAKLRFQRDRILGLDFPRKKVLLPAVGVMVLLFGAFMIVKDLGATMVLSVAFLTLFYVVTRARGWVLLAIAIVVGGVYAAAHIPAITQSEKVTLRLQMWLDPWYNAIPFGDQLARSRWAIAAGGAFGRGLGAAPAIALPAGHTDLVQAHLTEEMGAAGMIAYIVLLGLIAGQGIWLAAWNRTPERMLLGAGLAVLLIAQWLVIYGGTTGLVPLTGVVVPYLSYGKTGMIVFVLLAAMLVRLAESGRARETTAELDEVRRGTMGTLAGTVAALAVGIVVIVVQAVVWGPETTVKGCVTLLAQQPGDPYDRIVNLHDPRLQMIADQIKRGEILDRNGQKIVGTTPDGGREYPLGDAMGTLIGPAEAIVLRPVWMLERQLDPVLRGYPDLEDGPAVWMAEKEDGGEEFLFVVPSSEVKDDDRKRAEERAEGRVVRLLPLTRPDFRPLLPLMRASRETIQSVADDIKSRTATITIDAKLQVAASEIMKRAAQKGKAAASVVLDANTGEVLARAQWPDFDPGAERVLKRLTDDQFPVRDKKFTGIYGPWPDKTGISGILQAGSVFKVVTSLAAARAGLLGPTAGPQTVASGVPPAGSYCPIKAGPVHGCLHHDGQGPFFTRPGWYKAIHDHPLDPIHGNIEYIRGIALSCNVYFGQLGLQLGPDAFKKLVADGVEVGWGGTRIEPGKAGTRELAETAFGQAAALVSVSQLARVGGTVAGGGIYRKCPASMQKGAPCEQRPIVSDPTQLTTILAGLQAVATQGTARGLQMPPGLRLYGKTGTADMIGLKDEIPFGVKFNEWGAPNSWFLGIAESNEVPNCQVRGPQRVVVVVLVPRGGLGARTAGPAAMELMAAVQQMGYLPKPKDQPAPAAGQATAAKPPAAPALAPGGAGATTP